MTTPTTAFAGEPPALGAGYSAEISRRNPSCFLFLLDQSGSMAARMAGSGKAKEEACADAINRFIRNLALGCAGGDGIKDLYLVGVIGYGAEVGPAFGGALAGKTLVPISELASSPMRVEVRPDGKFPVWFEPHSAGETPMGEALTQAHDILQNWLPAHQGAYPPIVINITDGNSTDVVGDALLEKARDLTSLFTSDGYVLLFNCHISEVAGAPILFPATDENLPDDYARQLFQMSSRLPQKMQLLAEAQAGARGFAFNADLATLIQFLDYGTRVK